uniref:Centromere protein O n=2 Tax=Nothobranchius kadleci TaxID=1051664 RepID=A0A1A8CMY0_NOTKA
MEGASTNGVLSKLSLLEVEARSRGSHPQPQQSRVKELKAKVEALKAKRDQLKAELQTHKLLQRLRLSEVNHSEEEDMDEDSESSRVLRLMARHSELTDLLRAHRLIGGYEVVKTHQGKGVCVSIATGYEGVYLDTYNLEMDTNPKVRIIRHNIPPFIPLDTLAEQSDLQTGIRTFLDTLSQHLNAYVGRRQQLKLMKEQHKSVEVMESNILCSMLVLMFTMPEQVAVLCLLDYKDLSRCLPTQVKLDCEDEKLPDSPQWKKSCSLLLELPVHRALTAMKKMGTIV